MKYNLPQTIKNETDLMHYEHYLLNDDTMQNCYSFTNHLLKHIGKTARVYFNNQTMVGIISEVGKDFLTLDRTGMHTIIPFINIKAITLPQGNQMRHRC